MIKNFSNYFLCLSKEINKFKYTTRYPARPKGQLNGRGTQNGNFASLRIIYKHNLQKAVRQKDRIYLGTQ